MSHPHKHPPLPGVRAAMSRRGLSVAETALLVGRSRPYLSATLTGWYPLSKPLAIDLARVLDLDVELLPAREEAQAS